jgi:tetratricopeptide (TPR) repeat protein
MTAVLLALVRLALADPLDALTPAARGIYTRAEEQEAAGRFATAGSFYRLVLEQDPRFVPALLGLGRSLEAQGLAGEAEALYRASLGDPDVKEALATLLEATRPEEALAAWHDLGAVRIGDPGPWLHETRLLTRLGDAAAARAAWETYLRYLQAESPDGDTLLALADADPAGAESLLRQYLDAEPEGPAVAGARQRLDRIELEAAAALVDLGADTPLSAGDVPLAARVDAALAAGEVDEALGLVGELVARAPNASEAHGRYADALLAAGRWGEAEVQARIARGLAPNDAGTRARLGRLLAEAYGGRQDAEALRELSAAVRLRPGDAALRFQLAKVQQASGQFAEAAASFRAVLTAEPTGQWSAEARVRLDAIERHPPVIPEAVLNPAPLVSPEAAHRWRLGTVLLERGRRAEAIDELDAALVLAPTHPPLLNLRAGLELEAGNAAGAVELWRRSLDAEPDQADIWCNLAGQATDRDERRRHLGRAAELGYADAHYLLADLAAGLGDWTTAGAQLRAYFESATPASPYRQAAEALRAEVERRRRGVALVTGSVVSVAVLAPAAWWWRRRSGRTLAEMLAAAPDSWHEAARLLAGIRHEVLKHNTTVLPEVAAAVAAGDLGPWVAFASRLPELDAQLRAYVGALVALGRRNGVRLVPERDPVLGPLLRAFGRLRRIRRPDAAELRALSEIANQVAYAEIGRTVREICVIDCDEALVRAVYTRVCAEPGLAGSELPELWVTGGPLSLRLFRADLEDILANLLRNALSAGATTLALALSESEDEVTGHPLAEIAVIDDAPGTLTNAMVRSRFIGRGLGLAVDLTNRHGGSIRVDARADGAKAVVVQFQVAEVTGLE